VLIAQGAVSKMHKKRIEMTFDPFHGVVGDDGLEPPTYAL
jgi:hypothetical protein